MIGSLHCRTLTNTIRLDTTLYSDESDAKQPNHICLCLFGVLRRFQHCTGHITTGSLKGRGNQYIQFPRVVYCKLPTNGKQLPAFPLKAVTGIEPRPQRWDVRVLPLCHRGPSEPYKVKVWYVLVSSAIQISITI